MIAITDLLQAVSEAPAASRFATVEARRRNASAVVAVTGSAGKTTTSAFIRAALGSRFTVAGGQQDDGTGAPPTRRWKATRPQYAVIELGTHRPGDLAALAGPARPDISVITTIGWAHLGNFADRMNLAAEKATLLRDTAPDGAWVINGDDPHLSRAVADLSGLPRSALRRVGFGPENDVRIEMVDVTRRGTTGSLRTSSKRLPFSLAIPGRHIAYAAGFAVAVAQLAGVPADEAAEALAQTLPPLGHGELRTAPDDVLIIDNSASAGPDTMLAAAALMQDLVPVPRHAQARVVVLGQMDDLGRFSAQVHHRVGLAMAATASHVITLGDRAAPLHAGAVIGGLPAERVHAAASFEQARELLQSILRRSPGIPATVLVSGTRHAHLERLPLALQGTPVHCLRSSCPRQPRCETCPQMSARHSA